MKIKLLVFLHWLAWTLRLQWLTSGIFSFFKDGPYDKYEGMIPDYADPHNANRELLENLNYRQDKGKGVIDICRRPGWVEYNRRQNMIGGEQASSWLDCDEFARWMARALKKHFKAKMLSVHWLNAAGELHGHAVCLYLNSLMWYHGGNWGIYGPFVTITKAVDSIVKDGTFLYYAITDGDLKVICHGSDLKQAEKTLRKAYES